MTTVGELLGAAVERFEEAQLSYGHGTTNALDEAAWLVQHALGRPPRDIGPLLHLEVDAAQARAVRALVAKRIRTRKPAAYLTNQAWLGPHKFYVDERVIVPRSFIFEARLSASIHGAPMSSNGLVVPRPSDNFVPSNNTAPG